MLVERGEMDRQQAWDYAAGIASATAAELGEALGRAIRPRLQRVIELRLRTRERYDAFLEHISRRGAGAGGELPPELRPEAFGRLFDEMASELAEIEQLQPARFLEQQQPEPPDLSALPAPPPPTVPAPKLTGEAETLSNRLSRFERRAERYLRQYPGGGAVSGPIEHVRRLI